MAPLELQAEKLMAEERAWERIEAKARHEKVMVSIKSGVDIHLRPLPDKLYEFGGYRQDKTDNGYWSRRVPTVPVLCSLPDHSVIHFTDRFEEVTCPTCLVTWDSCQDLLVIKQGRVYDLTQVVEHVWVEYGYRYPRDADDYYDDDY
jgi:hypothetical protein